MLGTVGEASRMEGTVISDVVNLTSRLEELTRTFDSNIIVSRDLIAACPDTAGFRAVLAEDLADVAARHYIDRLLEIARTKTGQARPAGIRAAG